MEVAERIFLGRRVRIVLTVGSRSGKEAGDALRGGGECHAADAIPALALHVATGDGLCHRATGAMDIGGPVATIRILEVVCLNGLTRLEVFSVAILYAITVTQVVGLGGVGRQALRVAFKRQATLCGAGLRGTCYPFSARLVVACEIEIGHQEGGVHHRRIGHIYVAEGRLTLILRYDDPCAVGGRVGAERGGGIGLLACARSHHIKMLAEPGVGS